MQASTSPRFDVAIITAFRAPADLGLRTIALLEQVDAAVIIDDGTHSLGPLGITDPRIHSVELDDNGGIAAALNRGIDEARRLGATHVITLDQDSELPADYVQQAHAVLALQAESRPAAIVPAVFGDTKVVTSSDGRRPLDPIQSGQYIPMDLFDEVGGFYEPFFIDSVDTEFTLRARAAGREFYVLEGTALSHSLGEATPFLVFGKHRTIFGRKRYVNYHAPFRTYYIMRNGLSLWRMHRRGNVRWLTRRTLAMLWAVAAAGVLSTDRRAQFVAVRHGIRDWARKREGRIPPETTARIKKSSPKSSS